MSFTRKSIKLHEFLATLRYLRAFSDLTKWESKSRDCTVEFKGFLNSWAAEAKATVLSF